MKKERGRVRKSNQSAADVVVPEVTLAVLSSAGQDWIDGLHFDRSPLRRQARQAKESFDTFVGTCKVAIKVIGWYF